MSSHRVPLSARQAELSAFELARFLFRQGKRRKNLNIEGALIWGAWGLAYLAMGLMFGWMGSWVLFPPLLMACWLLLPLGYTLRVARSLRDARSSGFLDEMLLATVPPKRLLGAYYGAMFARSIRGVLPGIVLGTTLMLVHSTLPGGRIPGVNDFTSIATWFALVALHVTGSCAFGLAAVEFGARRSWHFASQAFAGLVAVGLGHALVWALLVEWIFPASMFRGSGSPFANWAALEALFALAGVFVFAFQFEGKVQTAALAETASAL